MARYLAPLLFLIACLSLIDAPSAHATHLPQVASPTPSLGALAYVSGGDLYCKPLPDGPSRRLTRDGNNDSPEWLPSGCWITYTHHQKANDYSGTQRFVTRDGRTTRSLPPDVEFNIGLDDKVIFETDRKIETLNLDTGQKRPLGNPSTESPYQHMLWSQDGKYLAYATEARQENPAGYDNSTWTLWLSGSSGGAAKKLYAVPHGKFEIDPVKFSPTNRYLLFWLSQPHTSSANADGVQLDVIDFKTGKIRQLVGSQTGDEILHRPGMLSFNPKNESLAIGGGGSRFLWENKWIAVADLHTGRQHRLTNPDVVACLPAWSPDGRRIACFTASPRHTGGSEDESTHHREIANFRLTLFSTAGKTIARMDQPIDPDSPPFWLNDGRHIVIESADDDSQSTTIYLADIKTRTMRPLVSHLVRTDETAVTDYSVWSPLQNSEGR